LKRTAIETAKLKAKLDMLKRYQDIDRRQDELKLQGKEVERLNEQEELHGELSSAEAIQKILQESELNDTIALQEATNRTNSLGETEKQRMLSTSGPNLQQIEANSHVPDEIKGHDKINDPIVPTTTPSQAADLNERITSTGARTSLNFPS